jgi:diguanylate cyclase
MRMWTNLDSKTRLRIQITAHAGLEYIATAVFLIVFSLIGVVETQVVYQILIFSVCVNAIFFTLLATGVSKQFKDPAMTTIQMFASCCRDLLGVYLAPGIWYLFVVNLFVALPFGALYFNRKAFIYTWALLSAGLAAILVITDIKPTQVLSASTEKALLWAILTAALARFLLFNAKVSSLRERLKQKVNELDHLSRKFAEQATHDELTGLINRREFSRLLGIETARSMRTRKAYYLAVIDVDYFKAVNDMFGHATGDLVLKTLADILRKSCRSLDVVGRYGGEEFILLLTEDDPQLAQRALERMRGAVEKFEWSTLVYQLQVTVSIGAVAWRADQNAEQLFRQADDALYKAKGDGRNRVVIAAFR